MNETVIRNAPASFGTVGVGVFLIIGALGCLGAGGWCFSIPLTVLGGILIWSELSREQDRSPKLTLSDIGIVDHRTGMSVPWPIVTGWEYEWQTRNDVLVSWAVTLREQSGRSVRIDLMGLEMTPELLRMEIERRIRSRGW